MKFNGTKLALDLKVARRRSGLTQSDVAHLLNIDRTLISKFERGKRRPSGEQVALMCVIYGLPLPEIYTASVSEIHNLLARRIKTLEMQDGPSSRMDHLLSLRDHLQASIELYGGTD